uniref:Uncharacterized protein n=1 Tax=viral metagenome TaxID=1070528 RepID=A0A6C0ET37_9ZZZZ
MLTFVIIPLDELVQGTKYKIEEDSYYYFSTFIGIYNGKIYDEYEHLLWKKVTLHHENKYENTERVKDRYFDDLSLVMSITMSSMYTIKRKVYKLISSNEKIQHAMEQRAINLILQKIIGDKTFIY